MWSVQAEATTAKGRKRGRCELDTIQNALTKTKCLQTCNKVDIPNSVSDLKRTPIFGWCMVGCESDTKGHMLKRDWTTCSEFVNHSRCKSQHNLGAPI